MTSKGFQVFFLILAMSLTWGGARAQSSCASVLITMFPCLSYISGNSLTPASSCCSALTNVVQTQPQCLCEVLNGEAASSLGIVINQARALELPSSCNVQTPPLSLCNGGGSSIAAAPSIAPTANPDEKPEGPSAEPVAYGGAGTGLKTVPGSSSDGSVIKSSLHLLALIVSFTSAFALF